MVKSMLVNLLSGCLAVRDESIHDSARSLEDSSSWIQNATPDEDASATTSDSGAPQEYNDAEVLRATFVVYGSVLLGVFVLFCYVRRRFPRPYNLRNWVEELKTPIAENQHGFFSWMWQLNDVSEDEILRECGLDALCFLRLLRMGYNIAIIGCFNALWLMPLYATGETDSTTAEITDRVAKLSIAHVPEGSPRCIGTVLAAYIFFGYIMYLILVEFEWFIEKRHKYLKMPRAQNYSVYVRNIPDEYKSNSELEDYFRSCFSDKAVLEARVRIKAPSLQSAVSKRDKLVSQLEHAINYEQLKGQAPQHRSNLVAGALVDSIPAYANALKEANDEVTKMIVEIEQTIERKSVRQNLENRAASNALSLNPLYRGSMYQFNRMEVPAVDDSFDQPRLVPTEVTELEELGNTSELNPLHISAITHDQSMECDVLASTETGSNPPTFRLGEQESNPSAPRIMIGQGVQLVSSKTKLLAKKAVSFIPSTKHGEFYNAGFVTFSSLRTTSAALQMIHHDRPFSVEVLEAPRPDDIFWANVGRSHKDLQVGNLLSLSATAALCLLWTIPMTFIASLSSVDALAEEFEFIEDIIEAIPLIGVLLGVLAPLFVKIANAVLPMILTVFSQLEGPVSASVVEASLFVKLAAFMIIQTFFVSAVTTGLMQELSNIIENPEQIISLLAVSLPSRSTYFIQIVFVGTVVALSMELLRIKPLLFAFIRRFLSPNLTEKERQTTVFGCRPLAQPLDFEGADNLSQIVLNFIVMLVYAVIAPLTVFIEAFCFMLLFVSYRNQFVHIYPANPDSGGKMWTSFIKILMTCMLIAEFTIVGLMALKKAVVAFPLMIPLIVITLLFNAYVHQQHFRAAEFLPSRECLKEDLRNGTDFDLSFTKGVYLQDEMRDKTKFPDNVSVQRAEALGLIDADDGSLLSAFLPDEVQQ